MRQDTVKEETRGGGWGGRQEASEAARRTGRGSTLALCCVFSARGQLPRWDCGAGESIDLRALYRLQPPLSGPVLGSPRPGDGLGKELLSSAKASGPLVGPGHHTKKPGGSMAMEPGGGGTGERPIVRLEPVC